MYKHIFNKKGFYTLYEAYIYDLLSLYYGMPFTDFPITIMCSAVLWFPYICFQKNSVLLFVIGTSVNSVFVHMNMPNIPIMFIIPILISDPNSFLLDFIFL